MLPVLAPALLFSLDRDPGMDVQDVTKIVDAGKNHNELYDRLTYLTQQIGPRVTGSPQLMAADRWAVRVLRGYGFGDAHLEQWGTVPDGFWRGPNTKGEMIGPVRRELTFSTNNWTAGTHGTVSGPAFFAPKTIDEVRVLGEKLKGAWILEPTRVGMGGARPPANPGELYKALDDAGIAGRIYSTGGDLVWTHGSYNNIDPKHLPTDVLIQMRGADFDAISAEITKGSPVTLQFNVDNRWTGPQPVYDVVADYPGTDLKDQVVIIGGHFDSWNSPGSQGAADNGTGAMIACEAARIIKATKVPHRRTLRVILYSGEEEGLLGSRGYVDLHKEDLKNFVAVLNDDEGTDAETGFTMLHGAEELLAPLPGAVNAAFPDMPISIRYGDRLPTGGSDHGSFVNAGVPAISWGKANGPVHYVFIWHTQNDRLENVYKPGLIQSSTCSALTLYLLLNSDKTLPRPEPRPPTSRVGTTGSR